MSTGMRYRSAPERRARLLRIVEEQGFCSTQELMAVLGVSDMTIRRDAQKLAGEGRVRVVHGGVSILSTPEQVGSREYEERASLMAGAKAAIGRVAAAGLRNGSAIAIDAGTTARELARALPVGIDVTVITHSAPVIADLVGRRDISLISLGGVLHHETLSFEGPFVLAAIGDLQLDTFYLSASGVGARGVYCANDFDAATKRALISVARRVVLLIDSSKLHTHAMVRVCDLSHVDQVLVDDGIDDADKAMLASEDLLVTLVSD